MSENLSDLLDLNLNDLADLPEFKVYPAGAHKVTINWETKKINEHPAIELKMKYVEAVELADAAETPPEVGTECSVAFMLDNEFGQGSLKKVTETLAQHFNTSKLGEVVEQSKGMEVMVVTKVRQNKDKTQTYCQIVSLQVL